MRLLKIDVKTPETGVKTKEGVSLWIDSVVTIQVYSDNSTVLDSEVQASGAKDVKEYITGRQQSAISNFLGMDEKGINDKVNDVLQGNLREIVSDMTVDQILTNRKQMALSVIENARPDLAKMGLEVALYKFPITEKMKERICAIMAMSCTVDPRKMVHRASIDRGIRDAYIALVWQYVVSSFGEKQQKNAILEKSTTIYNQRKLRKRELENKKYEEQLKQKASEVKKEVAEASTNAKLEKVKKELYDFKATSMKRETALRKKNDDAESRIHELEKLLANAERKLIQLRPETSEFDDFDDSDAGICEQETEVIDYHKELNQMAKNKKIVFCGGQQNFVNMLRNAQPDISYVDQCNLATCDALIANSDIVIFRVTQMSHSLYGKAKQICKARGIRFEHLPNVTSIPLTEELIYTLITKKEATGNE